MSRRKRSKLKICLIGIVVTKLIVAGLYLSGPLSLTDFLFTRDMAEAQEETSGAKDADVVETPTGDDKAAQYAEVQTVMNQLEAKRVRLAEEEKRIKTERDQLEQLKQDIDMKLEEMKAVQAKINEEIAMKSRMETQAQQQESEAEAAKIKQLVKVYSSMSPKKAAEIIDKLDMKVIYEVFSNMKGEAVGQILSNVSGERAAEITERLAAKSDN